MLLHSHLAFFEGLSTCCRAFNSYLYGALYNFSVYWSCWGKKCLIEMAIKCLLQLFLSIKYYFFNYILQLRSMTSFSTVVGGRVNFEGNSGNRSGLFCDRQMSRDPNIGTTKDKVQKLWKQANISCYYTNVFFFWFQLLLELLFHIMFFNFEVE